MRIIFKNTINWKKIEIIDILFFFLLLSLVAIMHIYKEPETTVERSLDWYLPIIHSFFDVSVILCICGILTIFKRRALYCLSFFLVFLWSLINIGYSRLFGQYISLSVFNQFCNMYGIWWLDYLPSLFKWKDLIFVLFLCFFAYFYHLAGKTKNNRINRIACLLSPILVLCFYYLCINPLMSYVKTQGKYVSCITELDKFSSTFYTYTYANPDRQVLLYGIIRTQFLAPILAINNIELSEDDIIDIKTYYCKDRVDVGINKEIAKNVVFILLESFLSATSDLKIDGIDITPTLNSLRHQDGTFYNGNIKSNTAAGESSDGQFIYWTGLLPLDSEITLGKVIGKDFYCLPEQLRDLYNYKTEIVLPSRRNFWKQNELDVVYGIDKEFEGITEDPVSNYFGNDAIVIDSAINICHIPQNKYFDVIVTMSTHAPYEERKPEAPPLNITFPDNYTNEYKNYLTACHYCDSQIGRYIEWLKQTDQYENTIIIIAADHDAHAPKIKMPSELVNDYKLPFYIVNSDLDLDCAYYGDSNQIDIFPTLLDLFKIRSDWRGIGMSLLNADEYVDRNTAESKRISNLLIRSDWFERN